MNQDPILCMVKGCFNVRRLGFIDCGHHDKQTVEEAELALAKPTLPWGKATPADARRHYEINSADTVEIEPCPVCDTLRAENKRLYAEREVARVRLALARMKSVSPARVNQIQGELELERAKAERLESRLAQLSAPKPGIPLKAQALAAFVFSVLAFQGLGLVGYLGHVLITWLST